MRVRSDKQTPNAYHVYEKVMQSIHDNITEEDLQAEIKVSHISSNEKCLLDHHTYCCHNRWWPRLLFSFAGAMLYI